jgi:ribose 1,5-bisphosphokinase PhnN
MFRISEDARAELLRLKSDISRELLYQRLRERVRDVVGNVDDRRLRQRRYQRLFGFTVTVAADTYLVLWRVGADQTVEIHYIGPDI